MPSTAAPSLTLNKQFIPIMNLPINPLLAICLLLMAANVIAEDMVVYRSPACSCCGHWIDHVKQNHLTVKEIVTDDLKSIKTRYGVSPDLSSCHTAVIGGYVIEGHVPARDIKKLIESKPDLAGLTVPGMPVGTPGMEMGDKKDAYDVISFDRNGNKKVFARYR